MAGELRIPPERVVYDSGPIAHVVQNWSAFGAGAQVVLIGADERPREIRVTDLITLVLAWFRRRHRFELRFFLRREPDGKGFAQTPMQMLKRRYRVIVVEAEEGVGGS